MERLVKKIAPLQISAAAGRGGLAAFLLLALLLGLTTRSHGTPALSASLEPRIFGVDESATLTITIHDAKAEIDQFPEVEGLVFQRRGQSREHRIINGSLSSSTSTIFQVQALRPGKFTIPAIALNVDGQQLTTQEIQLEVTPAAAARQQPDEDAFSPQPGENGQPAFLRISPVTRDSYHGELLPVEIKAYFRRGLRASLNSHPRITGDGFLLTLPKEEPAQTEEIVDTIPYAVLSWPGSLSGIKEGTHTLHIGVEATMLVPARNSRRPAMGGDPFFGNDLMADFFNQRQMQEKKVELVSPDMDLTVLPLPVEGRPEGFNGAVGRFELQVQAQPTEMEAGDPITLTMTVQGTGNFDRVEAPVLSRPEEWKSYAPSAKFTAGTGPGEGSKVFEQAIIARDSATTAIPPLAFSYFDPETRQYHTLHSAPIPLRINGTGKAAEQETTGEKQQAQTLTLPPVSESETGPEAASGNLAPLQPQLGRLHQSVVPLITRPAFQGIVLASLLLLITAIALKLRAGRRDRDPRRRRHQKMTRLLERRLHEIHTTCDQGKPQAFLALCRNTMQEQLGALWQVEAEAITLNDLHQHLAAGAPLTTLFATAENGVYGGVLLTSREMRDYAQQLEVALRHLA